MAGRARPDPGRADRPPGAARRHRWPPTRPARRTDAAPTAGRSGRRRGVRQTRHAAHCAVAERCNPPPATGAPTSPDPSTGVVTGQPRAGPEPVCPVLGQPSAATDRSERGGSVRSHWSSSIADRSHWPVRSDRSQPPTLSTADHCPLRSAPSAPAAGGHACTPEASQGSTAGGYDGSGSATRSDPRTHGSAAGRDQDSSAARRLRRAGRLTSGSGRRLARGGLQIPARPDHLRTASGGAAGATVRDRTGDRLVLPGVGASTAGVPLVLRAVERPLPSVVGVRAGTDRRLFAPTRFAAPTSAARRLGRPSARPGGGPLAFVLVAPVPRDARRRQRAGHPTPAPTGAGRRRRARPGPGPVHAADWRCGSAHPRRTGRPERTPRAHPTRRSAGARAGCHPRVPSPGNSRPECDPSEPKAESAVQV